MVKRIVRTLKQVAKHYGVRLDTVTHWRTKGMPGYPGEWDLTEIDKWRSTRFSKQDQVASIAADARASGNTEAVMDAATAKLRSLNADAKKKEADASLKQLQLLKAENADIVDLVDVEAFLTQLFSDARRLLMRIPPKMKRFGPGAVDSCSKQINLALHGIEKLGQQLVDLRDDE